MGFLLTYLLMFAGALIIQYIYSTKKVQKNISWIAYACVSWFLLWLVLDVLVIFGVFDGLLIYLNLNPWVNLPTQNTGLYWYVNCLLLGMFNLGIPIPAGFGSTLFALCLCTVYMPAFRAGQGWGKSMFGKRASQIGIYPFLKALPKPKNHKELEAEWKANEAKRAENEEEIDRMVEEGLKLAEKVGLKDKIKEFYR